jgi:hypothetical protein
MKCGWDLAGCQDNSVGQACLLGLADPAALAASLLICWRKDGSPALSVHQYPLGPLEIHQMLLLYWPCIANWRAYLRNKMKGEELPNPGS